jgi:hypothetical protein
MPARDVSVRYEPVTDNDQLVGVRGQQIVIGLPQPVMSRQEAIRHAAWLVALAGDDDQFAEVLAAVRNS